MLQLLAAEGEPLALAQISVALDLAKGTAHGLLRTLADVGFVEQNGPGGRYGWPVTCSGGCCAFRTEELGSKAMNWTDSLAARTGESARVAAFRDGHAVLARHVFREDDSPPHAVAVVTADRSFTDGSVTGCPTPMNRWDCW